MLIDVEKFRSLEVEEKVFYCSRLKFTLQFFPYGPAPIPAFPQGKEKEGELHVQRAHCSLPYEGGLGWVLIDIKKLRSLSAEEKVFYSGRLKSTL